VRRTFHRNCLDAAMHSPLPQRVIHVISSVLQPLPLFTQLRTYRCVAASVEKGQFETPTEEA
jgi:hypothetical protein